MFHGWRGCFCFLVPVVFLASPDLAQAEKAGKATKVKVTHFFHDREVEEAFDLEKKEDLAKLVDLIRKGHIRHLTLDEPPNIVDISWDLGLWTIVVFILLLLVLKKWAWGPMLEGLKKREEHIRNAAEEAKKARQETERVRADLQAEIARVHEQIPRFMEEARKNAERLAEEMRSRAQAEIQAERQRLRREIELALEQGLKEMQEFVADLATRIAAKALRRAITIDDHRRLVEEALEEIRRTGKSA